MPQTCQPNRAPRGPASSGEGRDGTAPQTSRPRPAFPTRCLLTVSVLLLAGHLHPLPTPAAEAASEYDIKAAWLLNFAKFTEWPATAFPTPDAPLVIGIYRRDPFGPAIDHLLANKTAHARPVIIRRIQKQEDLTPCHVLFLSSLQDHVPLDNILCAHLQRHPILTIGETEKFCAQGGMIQFVRDKNLIRFKVNPQAAREVGLRIDPKLLQIALPVEAATPP